MHGWGVAALAAFVVLYATFSRGLERRWISAAMFFVAAGVLLDDQVGDLLGQRTATDALRLFAEATLVVVLFTDASRLDVVRLRRQYALPGRLLAFGLPLTIAAGALAGAALLDDLAFLEALVLAIALAPTDAALGQAVVTDERVPVRVRQGLNVESGLNDGLCVPLLLIALSFAGAEEGVIGTAEAVRLIAEEIGWGLVGGGAAGLVCALAVRRDVGGRFAQAAWLQVVPMACAGLAYGISVALHGSGFIGAFVGGLVFGALRSREADSLTRLTEEVGGVLDALTFILFGATVLVTTLDRATTEIWLYALLSLTAIRMVPVALSLISSGARAPTVAYLGWFGPRGLASIVFAVIIIGDAGLPGTPTIVDTIALTVALSVLLHGLTAVPLTARYARWYGSTTKAHDIGAEPVQAIRWRRRSAEAELQG